MSEQTMSELMAPDVGASLDLVWRGYDRDQVDGLINHYIEQLAHVAAALEAATTQVHELAAENASLTAELRSARERLDRAGPPSYADFGERVAAILRLAEEEAGWLRNAAVADAARLREEAVAELDGRAGEVDDRTERHARELAAGRTAAELEWQQLRQDGAQHAQWLVEQAREQADKLVAEARAEVGELTCQQDQVHADLARVREVLAAATTISSQPTGVSVSTAIGSETTPAAGASPVNGQVTRQDRRPPSGHRGEEVAQ